MNIPDRVARRCIAFARDRFRNGWLHRLPIAGPMYKLVFRFVDTPAQIQFRGVTLRIDQSDTTITPTLLTGQYEATELDLLESILEPGMVVVDVGANNGAYTCISSQHVGPDGRVIAIEPVAENLDLLQQSVALNQACTQNVTIIAAAAGADDGTIRIHLDDGNSGTHSVGGNGERWQDVPMRPISDIVHDEQLEFLDVMKIDVEGFEPQVLEGAREALRRFTPTLLCEFDSAMIKNAGGSPTNFAAQLFAYGDVFRIDERHGSLAQIDEADCCELRNCNLLVVPPSRLAATLEHATRAGLMDTASV